MGPLMMMKSSFQLLLVIKESQNYSANIQSLIQDEVISFVPSPFHEEKFPSGTELKQNQIWWLKSEILIFLLGNSYLETL